MPLSHRCKRMSRSINAVAISTLLIASTSISAPQTAAAETHTEDGIIYLDQAWSQADREKYYQISQGARVMDYASFLNLEVPDSQELFRSDANSEFYGMTPQKPNPRTNPDGLPIGLAKTVLTEGPWKGEQIGLTCAACHNTQLNYKGKKIRIDGAPANMFDFVAYVGGLSDAMQATLNDPAKFDRLAAKVGASSEDAKAALRKQFESDAKNAKYYQDTVLVSPTPAGPARLDAISAIVNRLTSVQSHIPENMSTPVAPTKPPFLWNAPQGSWTQWRGVQQDPINRNLVETMGVFMSMDLTSKTPEEGLFTSSSEIKNLAEIEGMLNRLAPPKWPEEVFGAIDHDKARAGEALFVNNCASCHNMWPYTWTPANKYGKRFLEVGLVPQSYVGTDAGQFHDLKPYALTRQLAPYVAAPYKDKDLIPTGALYLNMVQRILDSALAAVDSGMTAEEKIALHGYREFPLEPRPEGVYKAAPRDGVWATPPFMHNGSVPNLYEMLLPADQRTKKFYVGREFDPIKVGLDTTGKSGKFMHDVSLPGNSNAGHSFEDGPLGNGIIGPLLTEEQRWALVEYLKSIPGEAGRITPFGGPPDAQSGNQPWANAPAKKP